MKVGIGVCVDDFIIKSFLNSTLLAITTCEKTIASGSIDFLAKTFDSKRRPHIYVVVLLGNLVELCVLDDVKDVIMNLKCK